MSDTATGILKDALKDAEAARDKVAKDTEQIRQQGARAQELVDAAQRRVDDLIEALDRLNRPEHIRPAELPQVADHQAERVQRPDVEERTFAGVGIVRRKAE